jgi:hypothetical protein
MADTLIFKIDTTPTVSALQDVNDLLTQSKNKLKELTDAGKQQTNEYIAQNAEVKALEKEQRALNNVLVQQQGAVKVMTKLTEENIKAGKAQENSIAENRKAYNALYNQLLQTAKPTKEQIATAKQLNTVLKEQEAALGNTSRNVGNYGQGFDELTGKLTSIVPGLKGFQTAQMGVNAVMNANPIGAVVMLFTALQEILGKNAEVADQLEFAMAGINKVFSVVVDFVVDGVKQFGFLADAFDKPGETIKKLGTILQDNLLNRFKALGGFVEAISQVFEGNFSKAAETASNAALQLSTGVVGLGSKIKTAYQEGAKAAMILDDLSETIGRNELAIEKNNIVIENNKILLAEKGKADEVRKKAAETIIKLEEENAAKRVSIAKTELQALREELKGRTLSGEKKLQILRAEAKVEKETADGIAATRKAKVEIEKLLNGESVESDNKATEQKQKNAENLKNLSEEFLLSEKQKLEKSFDDKKALIIGDGIEEQKVREAIQNAKKKAIEQFDADAALNEKAKQGKEFNDKIAYNQKQLQLDLNAVDLSVATEEEKARRKAEIQIAALEEQLRLTKEFLGADGIITEEEKQGIKAIEQAIAMAKNNLKPKEGDPTVAKALGLDPEAVEQAQETLSQVSKALQAVTDIVNAGFETRLNNIDATKNAEIDAINQSTASEEDKAKKIEEIEREAAMARYDIELKQFQANKATSIIQTIINTAQAVMAQLLAPPPAGFIFAGLAAATGAAQLALIASQPAPPKPKFATGVIGLDGPGTATSDSIDARLSRGESVMTAKATERFAPVLAQMEMAVGNRPNFQLGNRKFATGYIPTTDGGYSDRAMSNEVNNASTMAKMVSDSIAKMPQPKLVYDEFTNFVNNRNQSVNLSEL